MTYIDLRPDDVRLVETLMVTTAKHRTARTAGRRAAVGGGWSWFVERDVADLKRLLMGAKDAAKKASKR